MSNLNPKQFKADYRLTTVHQRGSRQVAQHQYFDDIDAAKDAGDALAPDRDGSVIPNVPDSHIHDSHYQRGLFWHGNRYAVIHSRHRADQD